MLPRLFKTIVSLTSLALLLPQLLLAQEITTEPAAEAAEADSQSLMELILSVEWVLYPLAILSLLILGLIIFNFVWLREQNIASQEFLKKAQDDFSDTKMRDLLDLCDESNEACAKSLSKVLHFAKDNPSIDLASLNQIAESEGNRQTMRINLPNVLLMDLGVMAPMVGLLGTVIGILRSFGELASDDTPMRSVMLAGGVSQALVATALGLSIGLLAMFFYAIFRTRVSYLIGYFETTLSDLMVRTRIILKENAK
ncbi:MAG: MotA/TolQ/ExbB proton channel family protein [Verrucomicrobiota bacterium]